MVPGQDVPDRLRESGAARWAFIGPVASFLAIYLVLHTAVPNSFVSDDTDQIIFSQSLAAGYHEQPPLYSWAAWLVFSIFGASGFSLGLLKSLILGGLYLALDRCGRTILGDGTRAALAAFSTILIPTFFWNSIAYLTHTNLACLFGVVTLHVLVRLRRDGGTADYAMLGLAMGLGTLSKYNYVIFAGALLMAASTIGAFRARLRDRRMLLALGIGSALVLPHAVWVVEHWDRIVDLGSIKAKLPSGGWSWAAIARGTGQLALNTLLTFGPLALVFTTLRTRRPFHPGERTPEPIGADVDRLLGRFFLVALGLFQALIVAAGASHVHERWLQPFALALPIFLFGRLDRSPSTSRRLVWYGRALAGCAAVMATAWADQVIFGIHTFGEYDIKMSFKEAADALRTEFGDDVTIVAEDRMVSANLRVWFPEARHACTALPLYMPPGPPGGKYVLVWNTAHGRRGTALAQRFIQDHFGVKIPKMSMFNCTTVRPRPGGRRSAKLAFVALPSRDRTAFETIAAERPTSARR